jgi:hypothetical protein
VLVSKPKPDEDELPQPEDQEPEAEEVPPVEPLPPSHFAKTAATVTAEELVEEVTGSA